VYYFPQGLFAEMDRPLILILIAGDRRWGYNQDMSLSEIIEELPRLSANERWQVIEQAMALEDLTPDELQLLEDRIAAHDKAPETSVPLEQLMTEFRAQYRL
jgi:hypothetical protein